MSKNFLFKKEVLLKFNVDDLTYSERRVRNLSNFSKHFIIITIVTVVTVTVVTLGIMLDKIAFLSKENNDLQEAIVQSVSDNQIYQYKVERIEYVEEQVLTPDIKLRLYSVVNSVKSLDDITISDSVISNNILNFKYDDLQKKVINKEWVYLTLTEKYGLTAAVAKHALKIAHRESRFIEDANNVNVNKSVDRGLFQINSVHESWIMDELSIESLDELNNAEINIKAFIKLFKMYNWQPWFHPDPEKHIEFNSHS